jgi:hypothetical protein
MKIAWFTPLSERSAIGRASTYIVRELAKVAEVELWHFEKGPAHPVAVKTVFAPAADLGRLAGFDLVVYNFGNHFTARSSKCRGSIRGSSFCMTT